MKTIKLKYIFCGIAMAVVGSCSEDFITTSPKGKLNADTYYSNESETYAALVGVYDPMKKNTGGFENMVAMLNAGSDDFWAGGGSATDGQGIQNFSSHSLSSIFIPASFWNDHYQGIYRANVLISKLPLLQCLMLLEQDLRPKLKHCVPYIILTWLECLKTFL
jgi:hypothetical protein